MIAGTGTATNVVLTPPGPAVSTPLGNFGYIAVDPAGQFLYLNETIGLRQLNLTTGILSAPLDVPVETPFLDQNGNPTGFQMAVLRDGSPVAVDPATSNVIYAIYEQGAPSESIFSYNPATGQKTFIAGKGSTSPAFLNPTSDVNLGVMNNGLGELVSIAPSAGSAGTFVASRSGWVHSMDSLSLGANLTTILGNGFRSWCGDGGPATSACLDSPSSVTANPDGSFFIADTGNSVVRFVDAGGITHSLVSPRAAGAPPTSLSVVPGGVTLKDDNGNALPSGAVLFTSAARRQVFALDPATDTTTLYSGTGNDACQFYQSQGFCDLQEDSRLLPAQYNDPRGIVIDPFANPYLAEPKADMVACLNCTDPINNIIATDPNTGFVNHFGNPYALALDFDNGLLIAEKGAQKIQRVSPDTNLGYVGGFFSGQQIVTDILTNRQLPLPNVTPLLPVGVARTPGHILVADNYSEIVWSTTRPPNLGTCPQGATCIGLPPPPQLVLVLAGGGTLFQDNIPAYQAAFGFRQVEAGVFDPLDAFGELTSTQAGGHSLVYITDRADNRIRTVDAGTNHPPVADAGVDRNVPLDPSSSVATVLLDGSASTDPDGDALSYTWSKAGGPLGTGAFVQAFLGLGTHAITLTVTDGFGGTSSATVNLNVTPPVDLAITAAASPTTLNTGDTLTYSATVTNLGPNAATGVTVTLPLLASTDFVSGTAPAGVCTGPGAATAGTITCPVGNLANGATGNLSINVKPNAAGTLASTLSVAGDQGDPDTSNNSADISVTVNPVNAVQLNVSETITVTDAVNATPSVMLSDSEVIHVNDAATPLPSVMLSDSEPIQVTDTPAVSPNANTPIGTPTIIPPNQTGQPSNVMVSFTGGVTASGYTSVTISPAGPALPAGFALAGNPAVYYDIQTTAQFNPPVVVCVPLNPVPPGAALLHFNTATQQWEDFTIRPIPSTGPICTQVNSLSPFAVVVPSNHPPTANAGTDQSVEAAGAGGALVSLSGSGSDPDNDPLTFKWSENGTILGTGAQIAVTLPVGVHSITLTADDGHGGTGTSTVLITVQDTTPPVLTVPASQMLEATSPAGAVAVFSATATDLVDGTRPVFCSPASGSTFPRGVTTVNCTASDLHGNVATGQFTITVRDTTPPVVTPPTNITVPATETGGARGSAWPALAAFLAGASAIDIADPAPARLAPQVGGVNADNTTLLPYGTTTVTFRFRDASGNVGTGKASVTVILGTIKISSKIAAQGVNPDGTIFVDVIFTNMGTGNARKMQIDLIKAVSTNGYGRITMISPALPVAVGKLDAGTSQTIRIVLKVPATVKQFALAEVGNYVNVKGVPYLFAQAQTVVP